MKSARSQGDVAVERLLRREQAIVVAAVSLLIVLAGLYTVFGIGMNMTALEMTGMARAIGAPMQMGTGPHWGFGYAVLLFFMWWIMMIAMMLPSASPMILLYARAHRHEHKAGKIRNRTAPTASFALGYLLIWLAFSIVATAAQWGMEKASLLHAMMMWSINSALSAFVLIAAGLYQFTPVKNVCLKHCRSPVQFLAENFRPGAAGAIRMGVSHGLFCLGCCWALMALLFVGGAMNLVWIAGLTLFVMLEKIAPYGHKVAQVAGMALIAAGVWVVVHPSLT